jgi:hypothetical protein
VGRECELRDTSGEQPSHDEASKQYASLKHGCGSLWVDTQPSSTAGNVAAPAGTSLVSRAYPSVRRVLLGVPFYHTSRPVSSLIRPKPLQGAPRVATSQLGCRAVW